MPFFGKQKRAQGIYGEAPLGHRPWWARPFAFSKTQTILGYLGTALLLYSVFFGLATVNCRNFETLVKTDPSKVEKGRVAGTPALPNDEKHLTSVGFQKAILIVVWVLVPPI